MPPELPKPPRPPLDPVFRRPGNPHLLRAPLVDDVLDGNAEHGLGPQNDAVEEAWGDYQEDIRARAMLGMFPLSNDEVGEAHRNLGLKTQRAELDPEEGVFRIGRGPERDYNLYHFQNLVRLFHTLAGDPQYVWLDGGVILGTEDEPGGAERRALVDRIVMLVEQLNAGRRPNEPALRLHRQPISEFVRISGEAGLIPAKRRQIAQRSVTLEAIWNFIDTNPGLTFDTLVEQLYRQEPWDETARDNGARRLKLGLSKLAKRGAPILVRYDRDRKRRFFTPNHETRLPTRPYGLPQVTRGVPVEVVYETARYLERSFGRDDPNHDPSVWLDRARELLKFTHERSIDSRPTMSDYTPREPWTDPTEDRVDGPLNPPDLDPLAELHAVLGEPLDRPLTPTEARAATEYVDEHGPAWTSSGAPLATAASPVIPSAPDQNGDA